MNKKLILFMTSLSLAVTPMGVFAREYNQPTATLAAVEERALLKAAPGEYRTTADGQACICHRVRIH